MRKLVASIALTAVCVILTGCPNTSTNQGAKDNPNKDNKGKAGGENVLEVKTNHDSLTLKQGDSSDLKVTVTRKPASWDEDVTITFENLPKGVTVAPADGKISKASTEGTFTLTAAADAGEVSNHETTLKAKSGDKTVSHGVKISVKKKSS